MKAETIVCIKDLCKTLQLFAEAVPISHSDIGKYGLVCVARNLEKQIEKEEDGKD